MVCVSRGFTGLSSRSLHNQGGGAAVLCSTLGLPVGPSPMAACCRRRRLEPADPRSDWPNVVYDPIWVSTPLSESTTGAVLQASPHVAVPGLRATRPLQTPVLRWRRLVTKLFGVRRLQVLFHATGEHLQVFHGGVLDAVSCFVGGKNIPQSRRRARFYIEDIRPPGATSVPSTTVGHRGWAGWFRRSGPDRAG